MPCLQRHMNKQLLQKCFYFNKMPHNLICFLFSSCNFYSKINYHFCHHFMVNITFNPTINFFYFYAPPMGHSFNPLLHLPLIPSLGPTNELPVFTDFHPSQINRFHLAGYTVILYLGTSFKKKNKTNTVA